MQPVTDNTTNIPDLRTDLHRLRWLLDCNQESIAVEEDKVSLLLTQIKVLATPPVGGYFTPDLHCVPGKWTCISWKDSNGIDHRVADSSFAKCVGKHLLSQPVKVFGLASIIAVGLSTSFLAGQAYQAAKNNGTIKATADTIQKGFYQVLNSALKIQDKDF